MVQRVQQDLSVLRVSKAQLVLKEAPDLRAQLVLKVWSVQLVQQAQQAPKVPPVPWVPLALRAQQVQQVL